MAFDFQRASSPCLTLGSPGSWEDTDVAAPDVFYDTPNSRWVMSYSGFDGAYWHTGLAYASTLDGTWTKEPANPILSPISGEGYIAANGSIVYKNGTYYLFYNADASGPPPAYTFRVCLATATSLAGPWTRQGTVMALGSAGTFDSFALAEPNARLNLAGDGFEMSYNAVPASAPVNGRRYARASSSDGLSWSRSAQWLEPGWANAAGFGSISHIDISATTRIMTFDAAVTADTRRVCRCVTSDAGTSWAYRWGIIPLGAGGQWDSAQTFDACPIFDPSGPTLWIAYAGAPNVGAAEGMGAQIGITSAQFRPEVV